MSHHILHVFKHGGTLGLDRGFVELRAEDEKPLRMPIEDIRAVVIAARHVTCTAAFLSAITESDAIILHCDENYRPCGWTVGLPRIVDSKAAVSQANQELKIHERIWLRVLRAKIENQAAVLRLTGLQPMRLEKEAVRPEPSESAAARYYWKHFLPAVGDNVRRRGRDVASPANHALNYGYAVLATLCHRSILIHGLNPLFGMHHRRRYKAHAFVYDVMEPLRPFVDRMLLSFSKETEAWEMKAWAKHVARHLRETRIRHSRYSLKLMDALDVYVASLAECYAKQSIKPIWVPVL